MLNTDRALLHIGVRGKVCTEYLNIHSETLAISDEVIHDQPAWHLGSRIYGLIAVFIIDCHYSVLTVHGQRI